MRTRIKDNTHMKEEKIRSELYFAFHSTIPVLTGFMILGAAYGILMQTKGYSTIYAVLMSAIAFCGSMQFVAITLLTLAFDPLQAFLLSLMVNARHLFYGISMLKPYKGLGKIRYFLIYVLCDETFSVSVSAQIPQDMNPKHVYFFISFLDYFYWIFGTAIGGLLGGAIHFDTQGLDFVLTALFVVLFLEQIRARENRIAGLLGILCTLLSLWIFGADQVVIPAMIFLLAILIGGKKWITF